MHNHHGGARAPLVAPRGGRASFVEFFHCEKCHDIFEIAVRLTKWDLSSSMRLFGVIEIKENHKRVVGELKELPCAVFNVREREPAGGAAPAARRPR